MKERLQIAKHANMVDEAMLILYQWANKDAFEQMKEEYRDKFTDNPDRYNQIWDTILEIYAAVKEKLKPKKDRIDYYFKSQNINFFFNASLAFLWDFQNSDSKLLTYEERFRDLKEEDRIKAYAQIVNIDEEDGASVEGLHTYEDFLKFLDEAACQKEVKWEVLQIFHNQEACYYEVTALLKEVIDLLENHYRERIAGIEKQFYEYWMDIQENNDILKLVQQKLKITWEEKEQETILLPMIFHPVSVTFSYQPEAKETDVLRLGILLDQHFNITGHSMNAEEIVNFGKLLSDKSKVDILELTAKKPCYGKEIAKELNLTTATISYHVNALMRLGLLKTELISNRVYYCMNYEKLSEYLEDIKEFYNKK